MAGAQEPPSSSPRVRRISSFVPSFARNYLEHFLLGADKRCREYRNGREKQIGIKNEDAEGVTTYMDFLAQQYAAPVCCSFFHRPF